MAPHRLRPPPPHHAPAFAASPGVSSAAPQSKQLPLSGQSFSSLASLNQRLVAWRSPSLHKQYPGGATSNKLLNLSEIRRVSP